MDFSYSIAGALTGFIIGLTGVGGGALMTPILLLFFGISPTTAIATDLWFAAITKLVGARFHSKAEQIDWQVVKRLWMGSLPMAIIVVIYISSHEAIAKVDWLGQAVGVMILITALGMLLSPVLQKAARHRRIAFPGQFKTAQPALTIISGALLGVVVSLTSIGAGALGSVILMYLYPLRMTPHRLVATDIVHAIPLAVVAGIGYLFAGLVDWMMLASLLLGSIPAIALGSLLAARAPGRLLQVMLALVLMAACYKLLSL